ncbi:hypothetical protein B0T26DRAFT_755464 [Lasiosphaeria miniovina]|uniref:Centrosomin N-terminal motif 1 domain-containing protein n=1 Tax=Lasiosphaeria miniovina TaxID=1954250 RepID=A0AA40DJW8_9PEZI|nr:uncharacterized protein B0T26DRAFT_755464 [Lasiosphaeria miniovina]KAK0705890.1 hypothetical protein B0T26DRAFT_755464 [Lasiosphaeria miniovina]
MSNNSSSSSQVAPPHGHRFHHNRCARTPTSERSKSQLSREASEQSLPPMSTFLQERLERERKVESERSLSRASNEAMSASADLRAVQSSPARNNPPETRRPGSSNGPAEPSKKKGLGLKEMEQTLSTLHKQNFDLKLELFHRRERQNVLEERVERLETMEREKAQTDEMNDQLIQELEKRDKAVEEAVAMIVVLEARVEQLLREREMVRQVEQDGLFYTRASTPVSTAAPSKSKMLDLPNSTKALNRMPSFLSDFSENTENLRNVYLGVRGSVLSLPRMTEDSHEAERAAHNGVSSPTLSVLSESSFLSVYGQKRLDGRSSPPPDSPPSLDGAAANQPTVMPGSPAMSASATPTKPRRQSSSRSASSGLTPFQNISDILDMGGSPLQRLEKLELTLNAMREQSRPSTSNPEKDQTLSAPAPPIHTQPKTKQEKREALQKVLTQGHLRRELHGLPPTPDTISTSTLRRYQNSDDTLAKDRNLVYERSYLALSETTASQSSFSEGGGQQDSHNPTPQSGTIPTFDNLKHLPNNGGPFDSHFAMSQLQRPRSASETTVSYRPGKNGWDSDSSDEFVDGMESVVSFDPWMRESMKPNQAGALDPMSSVSQAGPNKNGGRISPDLFSFPISTDGWATHAMFGTLGGAGYVGAGGQSTSPTPMADALDALGESLPAPLFGSGIMAPALAGNAPPPPPNRRSSLHAKTGSTSALVITSGTGSIPPSPARPSPMSSKVKKSPARGSRTRSNSIDARPHSAQPDLTEAGLRQSRAKTVPPKQLHLPPPQPQEPQEKSPSQTIPKQRHYPPTASQAPRTRGFNNLFRRSTGSAEQHQLAAPSSAAATETSFSNVPAPMMGAPSWGKRTSLVDDERASATPPPILRNKGPGRYENDDGGVPLDSPGGGGVLIGNIPGSAAQGPGSAENGVALGVNGSVPAGGGGKRKWLGLGRVGSLRNRGA